MTGPYSEIGRRVRQARKQRGMTRRQLAWWIRQSATLEVTAAGAALMVAELEDHGLVMNTDVLKRILSTLEIAAAESTCPSPRPVE